MKRFGKKSVVLLLAVVLMLSALTACKGGDRTADQPEGGKESGSANADGDGKNGGEESGEEGGLDPMTKEDITLSYACWGQQEKGEPEVKDKQLQAFMDAYPNINVEFVEIEQDNWNEALYNNAASGTLPDVFWVFSVTDAVKNQWALDVTDLFDADPDTQEIYPGVRDLSTIAGHRFHVPCVMFPHMIFLNKTLFEKYNEPLPDYDWTVDDFKEIAERMSHPEDYYFGTSQPIYYDLMDAWENGKTRYGWDGENYDMGQTWVNAWNWRLDWIDQKVCEWMSEEEKQNVLGDPAAWPPGKGRVAMHIDWPWTIARFEDEVSEETGMEFLYYPLPQGTTGRQMALIDNSVISATTEHPREAWELQKWTSWGKEACENRLAGYKEAGAPVSRLPVITNKEVWKQIIDTAPNEAMKAYYEHLTDIVPSPWPIAPGWGDFDAWMGDQDMIGQIERREVRPEDVVEELNDKLNEFKEKDVELIKELYNIE